MLGAGGGPFIQQVERFANRLLPGGRLKEFLRRQYRRRRNSFYALVPIVANVSRGPGDDLLVELTDGTRIHGPPDRVRRPAFEYADRERLGKLADCGRWSIFLEILAEEFVQDVYALGETLRPGGVVLDLGAHIGACTLRAARVVGPTGKVIALEPSGENHRLLLANLAANDLTNVVVLKEGAWSSRATLRLRLSALSGAHALDTVESDARETGEIEDVSVDTVDGILDRLGIGRVDVVKMDVEGAEIEVLAGMTRALASGSLALAIAAYHRVNGAPTHRTIRPRLAQLGFDTRMRAGIIQARKRGASP